MKITFIRPNMMNGVAGDALEPLVFALLSGVTPDDVECNLYDERIESIPFDEPTDLVAMTVDTFSARRSYQIAGHFHRKKIPVVMGGYHPTLCPEEALSFATSIVVGDGEEVWPDVVEDAKQNALKRVYKSPFPSLAGLRVDRRLLAGKKYRPLKLVQFGRGCPHTCDFCSIHAFYDRQTRQRPVSEVVGEIEHLGRNFIFFTDDNLFSNRAAAKDLMRALKSMNIHWTCQASLDIGEDHDLLQQMAASGCISVTVGFESLNPDNLALMRKSWNQAYGRYEDLISRFYDHGIMIYGTFIFGYDNDTPDCFRRSVEFAIRSRLFLANFNPLTPTPGTPLYARLQKEQRLILDPWWLSADYRYGESMFYPAGMTADQLAEGCYWARTEFNKYGSIFARALNRSANMRSLYHGGIYLAANLVSRKEIHRKQGEPLGAPEPLVPLMDSEP
ncbi:MAG: hypothetical protein A2X46_06520 [Lentisphaerae bacterium GWF2_57_35]|nr:MAG: hypothetical protein A2X46_06520 [Lentisphaerae bacterium GWF2_57_35]